MNPKGQNATEIKVGCWVTTPDDGGQVVRIEKGMVSPVVFVSDDSGREIHARRVDCTICPSPKEIEALKKAMRDALGGQPREVNAGVTKKTPRVARDLSRRGTNNYLR